MDQVLYKHTVEFYSATKHNATNMVLAGKWKKCDVIMVKTTIEDSE